MSAPLPLDSLGLSHSSRIHLTRAGFQTKQQVQQLRPTQLAHELGVTPAAALAILQELNGATALQMECGNGNGNAQQEQKEEAEVAKVTPMELAKQPPIIHQSKMTETKKFGENALELMRRRAALKPIPLLNEKFDEMMGGGVPVGQITEFCGVPGAGKTQLSIQLALNVQIPKRLTGPFDQAEAIYIDTEGSFLARRAQSIAAGPVAYMKRRSEQLAARHIAAGRPAPATPVPTVDDLLSGIHVYRAYDYVEQLAIIKSLPTFLRQHPNVHLLIIDSVAFHFRTAFAQEKMSLRSRLLTGMAQELLYLANQFQLAVVVTNQVTTKLDQSQVGGPSSLAPALGESWAHSCTHRIMLDYEGENRFAKLIKSPTMRTTQIQYKITEHGLQMSPTPPAGTTTAPASAHQPVQQHQPQQQMQRTQIVQHQQHQPMLQQQQQQQQAGEKRKFNP